MNKWNVQCVLILLCVVGSSMGMESDSHKDLTTQLFYAIQCSQIDQIKNIVEQYPDVVHSYHYWSDLREEVIPLHVAAHRGDITSLKLLLKNEAYEQCGAETKPWKRIPLHYAANKTIAKTLFNHRYNNIACKDGFNKTPLQQALYDWHARYDVAHYLLKRGGDINAIIDDKGNTLLHLASWCNNTDKVTFLLQHKANPAVYNSDGHTPLDGAIKRRHYQTIELFKKVGIFFVRGGQCPLFKLLQNNAQELRFLEPGSQHEIDVVNSLAQLLMCVRSSHWYDNRKEIVIDSDGIIFKHSSRDDLCKLFGKESINYVEQLIDECHVRVQTSGYICHWGGDTFKRKMLEYPFVVAYDKDKAFDILWGIMLNGDVDLFEWLFTDKTSYKNGGLVFKPDLSGVDCDGNTLLHRGVEMTIDDDNNRYINRQLIRILIENNIDLMHRNNANKTALDLMRELGSIDDRIDCRSICAVKFFRTPSYAPEYKNIKNFLKSGFDIRASTLLHLAVRDATYEKCLFLLKNGASPNIGYGEVSPLFVAVVKNFIDKIKLLLKYDALVIENMIEWAASEYIRALLQKKYAKQECCICMEHFSGISSIPCKNVHEDSRLCKGCYRDICEKNDKQCPLCRGELG